MQRETTKTKNMNKKILILSLLTLLTFNSILWGKPSLTPNENPRREDIVLDDNNSWDENDLPRSLNTLDLTCYYENGNVFLNIPFETGTLILSVTNLSTGQVWTIRQDYGFGWISMPTSNMEGSYCVEVQTNLYGDYIGYYTI